MATHRLPILGFGTNPDTSGNLWWEPFTVAATNDVWARGVWRFKNSGSARIGLHGGFMVPKNYIGTPKAVIRWTSTATTNNVVWDFDYRAVAVADSESLDQAGTQETLTVTDAAPTAALRALEATIALTGSNFAIDDEVTFTLFRDKSDANDNMAADALLFALAFEYVDA